MEKVDTMSVKKILLLFGLCLLFTGCTTGRNYNNMVLASDRSYISTNTGVRYLLGRGVPQNYERAFYYFNQGAREGDPLAQNEVAYMYAAGKGTKQDYRQAINWYQQAAKHGLASAEFNLGLMYLNGLGTDANKSIAVKWFEKSAAHGFEPAQQILARYR